MKILIKDEFELEQAQVMVKLLETAVIDELKIGEFLLVDNRLTIIVPDEIIETPSELVKEIKEMVSLINKEKAASDKAFNARNWDFCLSKEETAKALAYQDVFNDKFSVWYADVIDTMWFS